MSADERKQIERLATTQRVAVVDWIRLRALTPLGRRDEPPAERRSRAANKARAESARDETGSEVSWPPPPSLFSAHDDPAQLRQRVLDLLARDGALFAREIARRLGRKAGKIQGVLYAMAAAGLVRKRTTMGLTLYENIPGDPEPSPKGAKKAATAAKAPSRKAASPRKAAPPPPPARKKVDPKKRR